MPNIFISYSRKNKETAFKIKKKLQNEGISGIFIDMDPDEGLLPGSRWAEQLRNTIAASKVFLILYSKSWPERVACIQEYNWAIAAQNASHSEEKLPLIIPVLFYDRDFVELKHHRHPRLNDFQGPRLEASLEVLGSGLFFRDRLKEQQKALDALWERLRGVFATVGVSPTRPPYDPVRGPYRGLEALQEADAAVFFGRETVVDETMDQLARMRERGAKKVLAILAASGAGKSSLLRAGLMPRIGYHQETFLLLPVWRPGNAALSDGREGFVTALREAVKRHSDLPQGRELHRMVIEAASCAAEAGTPEGQEAARGAGSALAPLEAFEDLLKELQKRASPLGNAGNPVSLVLPIDQAEELLPSPSEDNAQDRTRNAGAQQARKLLACLLARRNVDLIAIMALRSDSFPAFQENAELGQIEREMRDLPPLPQGSYRSVIEEPAKVAKIELEDELVEALLSDLEGLGDALPLLAFVLQRMWNRLSERGRPDKTKLTLKDYEELGAASEFRAPWSSPRKGPGRSANRLGRAIGFVVTDALGKSFDTRALRKAFVPHLVYVNENNVFLRRPAPREQLPVDALPMIDALVNKARILVAREDKIEVTHEAVLRRWDLLRGWLGDAKNELAQLSTAENDAKRWVADRDEKQNAEKRYRLDLERLYPQERLVPIYAAFDNFKLSGSEDGKRAPSARVTELKEFVKPEYLRLTAELSAQVKGTDGNDRVLANHARRFQIGNRLNELGDPRPGVSVFSAAMVTRERKRLALHRRLGLEVDEARAAQLDHIAVGNAAWETLPDIVWCPVPAGDVTLMLETDKAGKPIGSPTARRVETPFWVSKYPLTIEQFNAFALERDAQTGGFAQDKLSSQYKIAEWWDGFPDGFNQFFRNRPNERDPQLNFPAQFVNWFQAIAYSRWLTSRYRGLGLMPTEACIRLPTEWEWQQAATGGDNSRFYPWGNDWNSDRCRNRKGQDSASSVGLYPLGDAPTGASDLSGLIVEWCLNTYDDIDDCNTTKNVPRPTRGGAYFTFQREELPDYTPEFALSVHGRLRDNPSGIRDKTNTPIRTGVRLICTGLDTSQSGLCKI